MYSYNNQPFKQAINFPTLNFPFGTNFGGNISTEEISKYYEKTKEIIREIDEGLAKAYSHKDIILNFGNIPNKIIFIVPANRETESGNKIYESMWKNFGYLVDIQGYKTGIPTSEFRKDHFPYVIDIASTNMDSFTLNLTSVSVNPQQNDNDIVTPLTTSIYIGTKLLKEIPQEFRKTQNGQRAYRFAMLLTLIVHEGFHMKDPLVIHDDSTLTVSQYKFQMLRSNRNNVEIQVYSQEIDFLKKYKDTLTDREDSTIKKALEYIISKEEDDLKKLKERFHRDIWGYFGSVKMPPWDI